jgi:hypothetical protein
MKLDASPVKLTGILTDLFGHKQSRGGISASGGQASVFFDETTVI